MCKAQERECERYLFHLASVYNWAVRKIELNAKDKIYFTKFEFNNLLAGHGKKLDIPSHVLAAVLCTAFDAWGRCFKKISGKPRLKGKHNKLNSIPFPDPIKAPKGNRIRLVGLESIRFHKMDLPDGKIKCGRIIKRASGWYLCLWIDAEPKVIERTAHGVIGIDPGFSNLITTSDGEIVEHPREMESAAERHAQAQRGNNIRLASRIQERVTNRKKDRNHKLSHRLVAENIKIVFSKDPIVGIAKKFGKSVRSSAHGLLRQMLAYKSPQSGTEYVEVLARFSTMTCNECGSKTGPTGFAGLRVRQWVCTGCGAEHDRDINAARNTLKAGAGCAHESCAAA